MIRELVKGDTLADCSDRGAILVEESLKLVLQIAEALDAAREMGVIHCDLKPVGPDLLGVRELLGPIVVESFRTAVAYRARPILNSVESRTAMLFLFNPEAYLKIWAM